MNLFYAKNPSPKFSQLLPWLHFFGALLVFVLISLFTAIHSELGNEISAGESPGFAWISANIIKLLWMGLAYLVFAFWVQHRENRLTSSHFFRVITVLFGIEFLSIALIAVALFYAWYVFLPTFTTVLLASILLQGVVALNNNKSPRLEPCITLLKKPERNIGLFLAFLFFFGALLVFIDPSWNRLNDSVVPDTGFEHFLGFVLPLIFSGITSLWFGIGLVVILIGSRILRSKLFRKPIFNGLSLLFPFFFLVTGFAVILLGTLFHAIEWKVSGLHLKPALLQLIILTGVCGSALLSTVFRRIADRVPQAQNANVIGVVSLSIGAALFFPITWLITLSRHARWTWPLLLFAIFGGILSLEYLVLYGNVFNPWFTSLSFLIIS